MKKYVFALVMLLTTLCTSYAQTDKSKNDQSDKKTPSYSMTESDYCHQYISELSSIISLSKKQKKEIEKQLKVVYKKRVGSLNVEDSHEAMIVRRQAVKDLKVALNRILSVDQQALLESHYSQKKKEILAKEIKG